MNNKTLDASCRVALCVLLTGVCDLIQKADAGDKNHTQLIKRLQDGLPDYIIDTISQESKPFDLWDESKNNDSMLRVAASSHSSNTRIQLIITMAQHIASGLDPTKDTNNATRHQSPLLSSILEQVKVSTDQTDKSKARQPKYHYQLAPLTVENMFPKKSSDSARPNPKETQTEYQQLLEDFFNALKTIPESHNQNQSMWLDHFDNAWAVFSQFVPKTTSSRQTTSLYDHSRVSAAVATALWRYYEDSEDLSGTQKPVDKTQGLNDENLLMIQGDFLGIQNFIFASGSQTEKKSARLLRGRSFYISLLAECAVLKILETLALPPTSQIINAAGKFLILAPNTPIVLEQLQQVQQEINTWLIDHTHARVKIGIASIPVKGSELISSNPSKSTFNTVMERLLNQLDRVKRQCFDLCSNDAPTILSDKSFEKLGECQVDRYAPAQKTLDGINVSHLAYDHINIGKYLTTCGSIAISSEKPENKSTLSVPIFGFYITFVEKNSKNPFIKDVIPQTLKRVWDIKNQILFTGLARRAINAYVPIMGDEPESSEKKKYDLAEDFEWPHRNEPKTFDLIACEDRTPDEKHSFTTVKALVCLKGDVDNLGQIFQSAEASNSLVAQAMLSRQLSAFFSTWLPYFCAKHPKYQNIYTVFAGGDDFFLIGPWYTTLELASEIRCEFNRYVADNSDVHFSVGFSMFKPGIPIRQLGAKSEAALEQAKEFCNPQTQKAKNAVTCFGFSVAWDDFTELLKIAQQISAYKQDLNISTGYIYGLLNLATMSESMKQNQNQNQSQPKFNIEDALWNSRFSYRTWRMLESIKGLDDTQRKDHQDKLGRLIAANIQKYGAAFKIALSIHLYRHRR